MEKEKYENEKMKEKENGKKSVYSNICVCKCLSNNFKTNAMKKIRNIRRSKLTISIIVAISRDIMKKMMVRYKL